MKPSSLIGGYRSAKAAVKRVIEEYRPKTVAFRRDFTVIGEYPFEKACRMVESGEIRMTDEYLHEGMRAYKPVSKSNLAKRLKLKAVVSFGKRRQ